MAASIKYDERPVKGEGLGGLCPPQPKPGRSGGQRPPAKTRIFSKFGFEKVFEVGTGGAKLDYSADTWKLFTPQTQNDVDVDQEK